MSGDDKAQLDHRLAAILAADVVGYSRLMAADEAGTLVRLTRHMNELVEPTIAAHRGRLFKTMGDGFLVQFGSAIDALRCALALQKAMAEREADQPDERRMMFRVGLNLGDVIVQGDDVFGDGVNVAARLEALATPGGVLMSANLHDQVIGKLEAAFVDRGEQQLKNMPRPVRAYEISDAKASTAKAIPARKIESPPGGERPSIAVLPFTNMSGDAEQDYFADGMVEDIITALSRFRELVVIARNSSFVYKGRAVDIAEVARDLGVRYVLEGSVRKAGNRMRITGQLIDTATRAHLWADRFDGALEDVFDLQDRITESVVGALAPTLRQAEIERARRKPTENLDAYDYLLRAMPHLLANTITEAPEAIRLLTEALRRDPDYAQAHAQMAMAYGNIFRSAVGEERERTGALGLSHARRVIALGANDGNALAIAGFFLIILGQDMAGARSAVDKAVALNANSAVAITYRSVVLAMCGEAEAAIVDADKAMRLNPTDPNSFLPEMSMVLAKLKLGDNDDAASWARRVIHINLRYPMSYIFLMIAECRRGHRGEAEVPLRQLEAIIPDFGPKRLANMLKVYPPELRETSLATLRAAGFLPET